LDGDEGKDTEVSSYGRNDGGKEKVLEREGRVVGEDRPLRVQRASCWKLPPLRLLVASGLTPRVDEETILRLMVMAGRKEGSWKLKDESRIHPALLSLAISFLPTP